ncbi:hypothetical protein FTUN_3165 [Frigoriglobus tundricola]|uniref:Uncharacterized protein n=1 Tax=Frigoriglobus tundricola TaxID=2774151 RepID=A0A6M5YNQ5_9BACT|nr:hypothetical protein FTUN_3165 [Frigoriglobus tundricola]
MVLDDAEMVLAGRTEPDHAAPLQQTRNCLGRAQNRYRRPLSKVLKQQPNPVERSRVFL